jgi:hypothetical protein
LNYPEGVESVEGLETYIALDALVFKLSFLVVEDDWDESFLVPLVASDSQVSLAGADYDRNKVFDFALLAFNMKEQ